jgi:hypothetical protein
VTEIEEQKSKGISVRTGETMHSRWLIQPEDSASLERIMESKSLRNQNS